MPYEEIQFIDERIRTLTQEQQALPATFDSTKAQIEQEIATVLSEAGVLGKVRALERKIENARTSVQRAADKLAGRIEELRLIRERLQQIVDRLESETAGRKAYPDVMYGVDLRPLDDVTRMMVMSGRRDTIVALGGTPPTTASSSKPT